MTPKTRGKFITLEGGEGVGKSTLAANLQAGLRDLGESVVLTREPGGVPTAEAIRELLLHGDQDIAPLGEVLLFNAARSEHLNQLIRPALQRGDWVNCDRFMDSTRAYQLASDPSLEQAITTLDELCVGGDRPDLTFMLDLAPKVRAARLAKRAAAQDRFEARSRDFHDQVRAQFLKIAARDPIRCTVLDAATSPETLAETALSHIKAQLTGAS